MMFRELTWQKKAAERTKREWQGDGIRNTCWEVTRLFIYILEVPLNSDPCYFVLLQGYVYEPLSSQLSEQKWRLFITRRCCDLHDMMGHRRFPMLQASYCPTKSHVARQAVLINWDKKASVSALRADTPSRAVYSPLPKVCYRGSPALQHQWSAILCQCDFEATKND